MNTTVHGHLGVRQEGMWSIVLSWPHPISVPPDATLEVWLNHEQVAALYQELARVLTDEEKQGR